MGNKLYTTKMYHNQLQLEINYALYNSGLEMFRIYNAVYGIVHLIS